MTTVITGTATLTGHLSERQFYKASYNKPIIGDMRWRVTTDSTYSWSRTLDVGVVCLQKDNASDAWFCDAEIEFRCVPDKGEPFSKKVNHCFKKGAMSCKVENFGNVLYALKSFTIDAHITLKPDANLPTIPSTDFGIPRNTEDEIVLLVGDRKLYVNKHLLMSHSTLFNEMLSPEDNEKKEIEIKDVKYGSMVAFLRFLTLEQLYINYENVEDIFTLADRYNIQNVMVQCERALIDTNKITTVEKLRLADKFKLEVLQKEVMQNITKAEIKKIFDDIKKYNFRAETKDALLVNLYTMCEEKPVDKPYDEKFYDERKFYTANEQLLAVLAVVVAICLFLIFLLVICHRC